ncbi:hypothetical protein KQI65_01225 [bacterium]|nr:hypothetical protein [bacterium]
MAARRILGILIFFLAFGQAVYAGEGGEISKYFNDASREVKATDDPVQKRDILMNSLQKMNSALEMIENTGLAGNNDRTAAMRLRTTLQEKQDELMGENSFERVSDAQLNAFSDYVVQDMQQADQYVTLSLVTILLIVILLVLIL